MHTQHYLLCYDITNVKRLSRVYRYISPLMLMIQYSVYYAELMPDQMAQLVKKLTPLIDAQQDDIRIYCIDSLANATLLGRCGTPGIAMFDSKGKNMWGGQLAKSEQNKHDND